MKTLFTTFSLLFIAIVLTMAQNTLSKDSLLAYYNFDDNFNNQVSNKYNLTIAKQEYASNPVFVPGIDGKAIEFNGLNALINNNEFGAKLANSSNKSFSVSLWVKTTGSTKQYSTFFEAFETLYFRGQGTLEFGVATQNAANPSSPNWNTDWSSTSIANNQWDHFAFVFDSPNKKLHIYKNGSILKSISTTSNAISLTNNHFIVGAGSNGNIINFTQKGLNNSQIDEMMVFNRTLSANEITALNGLVTLSPPTSVNNDRLLAYYPLDTDFQNASGTAYHLTSTNAPEISTTNKIKGAGAVSFNSNQFLKNDTEYGQYWNAATDKSMSVSLWVNRNTVQGKQYNTIFEFFESLYLRQNLTLGIAYNANNWFEAGTSITNNSWQHVVAVYDSQAQEIRIYVGGLLKIKQTGISAFHRFNQIFILGAGTNSSSENLNLKGFNGLVDEMYVFNRVLNRNEIAGLTNLAPVQKSKAPVNFSVIGTGGTITAKVDNVTINSGDLVEIDKTILFTANPDAGNTVTSWDDGENVITFTSAMPTTIEVQNTQSGITRRVAFGKANVTVNFSSSNQYGSIVAFKLNGEMQEQINSGSTVPNGTIVRFVAAPINNGYKAKNWWLDNIYSPGLDNQEIVTLTIRNNTSIAVDFGRDQNMAQINFNAGSNGTITAYYIDNREFAPSALGKAKSDYPVLQSGDFVPKSGTRINFVATPDQGYKTNSWSVNNSLIQFEGVGGNVQVPNTYDLYNPTSDVNLIVSFVVAETSVRNASFETLTLYPNPAQDMVRIVAESNIDRVEIYSLSGTLQQTETAFGVHNMNIQLGNLNAGMYLLKIFTNEGIKTAKLQIKR